MGAKHDAKLDELMNRDKYSKEEYDAALNLAKFIFDLRKKRLESDIIKMDKMQNDEEPQNTN